MLIDYSTIIDSLEQKPLLIKYKKKRDIFSKIEDELISKYGYSIKKLRRSQGRILIRLAIEISIFLVIKVQKYIQCRFLAVNCQNLGHNLLSAYNPNKGEDRMIEYIINKIEMKKKKLILYKLCILEFAFIMAEEIYLYIS